MQRIKIIVDSPSDIPDKELEQYDIKMVGVPIQLDGKEYIERESFSCTEFYPMLESAKELPTTSRISIGAFYNAYRDAWESSYTDVIVVTINAGGSGTHNSAQLAAEMFFDDVKKAVGSFSIHIVDSMTYCAAYGYPAVEAAKMAQNGKATSEILEYLRDFFSRLELLLVCYTLEYAKKSGRITAAAAMAGDLLGLRPIIAMIDGTTEIISKVRGDRKATKKLLDLYRQRRSDPDDVVLVISAAIDEYGQELVEDLAAELDRPIPHYKAGAAIAINAGPQMVALGFLSEKRKRDEVSQPSVITFIGTERTAAQTGS